MMKLRPAGPAIRSNTFVVFPGCGRVRPHAVQARMGPSDHPGMARDPYVEEATQALGKGLALGPPQGLAGPKPKEAAGNEALLQPAQVGVMHVSRLQTRSVEAFGADPSGAPGTVAPKLHLRQRLRKGGEPCECLVPTCDPVDGIKAPVRSKQGGTGAPNRRETQHPADFPARLIEYDDAQTHRKA